MQASFSLVTVQITLKIMFLFAVAFLPVVFKIGFVSLSTLQHRNCPNGYRLKAENSACIGKSLTIHGFKKMLHLYSLN